MADRNYFKGKRIAMIGLGPHGEMVEDAKFLINSGAFVSIYDLRSEPRLRNHLVFLRSIGLANYICGSIPPDDLVDSELIILSHEYPRNSSFLSKIEGKNIPIEYPETLFFKLAPPLTVVGVIGSAGKTSVISILAPLLETVSKEGKVKNEEKQRLFVADSESGNGLISALKKAQNGDILLIRIAPQLMSELYRLRISPYVAIFVTLPQGQTYESSPFELLSHQTYNNFLIASDEIIDLTRASGFKPRAKMLRTKTSIIPPIWEFNVHEHDRMNAALALQAARLFKVSDDDAQKIFETWKVPKGRLEIVKKVKGIEFYNDTASTSPTSTISGLKALSKDRNIVLICGGSDSGHEYSNFIETVPQYAHTVILVPGSGTMKERKRFENMKDTRVLSAPDMEEAVRSAREHAKSGDRVLFSPAFSASGAHISRKERGERFVRAVRGL